MWLFDTTPFVPRVGCGDWPGWLVSLTITSDLLIAITYFTIPVCLWYLWRQRRDELPKPWMLVCFIAFITLCGLTHVMDALMFFCPVYRLLAMVLFATALVSMGTAVLLPSVVKYLLTLSSPEEKQQLVAQLRDEIAARIVNEEALIRYVRDVEGRCRQQQEIIDNRVWAAERRHDIATIRALAAGLLQAEPLSGIKKGGEGG